MSSQNKGGMPEDAHLPKVYQTGGYSRSELIKMRKELVSANPRTKNVKAKVDSNLKKRSVSVAPDRNKSKSTAFPEITNPGIRSVTPKEYRRAEFQRKRDKKTAMTEYINHPLAETQNSLYSKYVGAENKTKTEHDVLHEWHKKSLPTQQMFQQKTFKNQFPTEPGEHRPDLGMIPGARNLHTHAFAAVPLSEDNMMNQNNVFNSALNDEGQAKRKLLALQQKIKPLQDKQLTPKPPKGNKYSFQ